MNQWTPVKWSTNWPWLTDQVSRLSLLDLKTSSLKGSLSIICTRPTGSMLSTIPEEPSSNYLAIGFCIIYLASKRPKLISPRKKRGANQLNSKLLLAIFGSIAGVMLGIFALPRLQHFKLASQLDLGKTSTNAASVDQAVAKIQNLYANISERIIFERLSINWTKYCISI